MNEERRPAGDRRTENAAKHSAAQSNGRRANSAPLTAVVHLPLGWAESLIANAAGPIPEYGSHAWAELPDESKEKVAATVSAAEKWRTRDRSADVYTWPASRRAREIAEARRPRPGDYQGGPVSWDREQAVPNG